MNPYIEIVPDVFIRKDSVRSVRVFPAGTNRVKDIVWIDSGEGFSITCDTLQGARNKATRLIKELSK